MKRIIKPADLPKAEQGQHTTTSNKSERYTVWIDNKSTLNVRLGALDEEDLVLIHAVDFAPNERKLFSINSDAILAIELDKLPPEDEALFFANGETLDPDIQIADATDELNYPIRIGIASEVFSEICWEDFGIAIVQANKYPDIE